MGDWIMATAGLENSMEIESLRMASWKAQVFIKNLNWKIKNFVLL